MIRTRYLFVIAAILLMSLGGCAKPEGASSSQPTLNVDNTDPSGKCVIIIFNTSPHTRSLMLKETNGRVLVDAQVPSRATSKPPQWRSFRANVAGQTLSITLAGATKEVAIGGNTVEIDINVGQDAKEESAIIQRETLMQWL
jgi:hypothetical protein